MRFLKRWWEGERVLSQNDPNSAVVFMSLGSYRRHWSSRAAHWAIEFYMREWKWTLGAVAAVIGALVLKR
ncbi:hypothetical protein UP10_28490 [Bradyrhizobium sp. LTSPM299]|nr:hypothetical protein UP10_28490 [Bradyrhizobium sp. LTSPM299]